MSFPVPPHNNQAHLQGNLPQIEADLLNDSARRSIHPFTWAFSLSDDEPARLSSTETGTRPLSAVANGYTVFSHVVTAKLAQLINLLKHRRLNSLKLHQKIQLPTKIRYNVPAGIERKVHKCF